MKNLSAEDVRTMLRKVIERAGSQKATALESGCSYSFLNDLCPNRSDNQHCNCWYDGGKCCACGAPAMTDAEKIEQGMETEGHNQGNSNG